MNDLIKLKQLLVSELPIEFNNSSQSVPSSL